MWASDGSDNIAMMNATGTTTERRRIPAALLALFVLAACPATSRASLTRPTNTLEGGIQNAILRGDAQELRVLLEQAGELSSSDAAIARRALVSMERVAVQDAKSLAQRYGIDWANKVQHALKTPKTGPVKEALFRRYGTAEAIFTRLDRIVVTLPGLPAGYSLQRVVLDGLEVTIRCFLRDDGVAILSTIEKW